MSTQHSHLQLSLGDTVKVKLKDNKHNKGNKNIGTILFYGNVESHTGKWYGLSFKAAIGKNDGTYKKRKYFECKPKHGYFVRYEQIIKIIKKSKLKHNQTRIHLNANINLPHYGMGKIQFAGLTAFSVGIWYGIELKKAPRIKVSPSNHQRNGTISGVKYFECAEGNALFRRSSDLQLYSPQHRQAQIRTFSYSNQAST